MQSGERLTLVSRSPVGLAQTLPFIHYLLSYLLGLFSLNRAEEQSVPGPPSTAVPVRREWLLTSKAAPRVGTGPELLGDLSVPPRPAATPLPLLGCAPKEFPERNLGSWPLLE